MHFQRYLSVKVDAGSVPFWVFLPVLFSFGCSEKSDEEPPNVIVILADDLGYGDLQCYHTGKVTTPNSDRIAREGMLFTDAHSPSAVCSPSRYAMLTGNYAWRTWLKNWIVKEHMPLLIDSSTLTIQRHLQLNGYNTGCIGKWHLGWGHERNIDWNGELKPGPIETGFDYYFGVPYSHNSPDYLCVFVENDRIVGLREGESVYDSTVQKRVQRKLENTAINLTKEATNFITSHKDEPFFLYYPTTNVHAPITPNSRFQSEYGGYGAFVKEFDWTVGQIDSTLSKNNLKENTILIITSDNGAQIRRGENGHFPNGNLRGEKGEIYEGGHRIPFIARWPDKIPENTRTDATITLTDIFSTIAALINSSIPYGQAIDSYDFSQVLIGNTNSNFQRPPAIHHSVAGMYAIRGGKWKFIDGLENGFPVDWPKTNASAKGKPIRDSISGKFEDVFYYFPPFPQAQQGEPSGQLYDLENDLIESENLFGIKPKIVDEMKKQLEQQKVKY